MQKLCQKKKKQKKKYIYIYIEQIPAQGLRKVYLKNSCVQGLRKVAQGITQCAQEK